MKILDAILADYQRALGPTSLDAPEMARFRDFLVKHGGLRKLEAPGREVQILDGAEALRCFHFSQYLDWYLPEKAGASKRAVEGTRSVLGRFNTWLFERNVIGREDFAENRESIQGFEDAVGTPEGTGATPDSDEETLAGSLRIAEEKDFYVPGEYADLLSGEFVLTKVQEGILYGVREGDREETGPILVDRTVSGGSRVGDRIHLSLGRAGDHWNLLGLGPRKP